MSRSTGELGTRAKEAADELAERAEELQDDLTTAVRRIKDLEEEIVGLKRELAEVTP